MISERFSPKVCFASYLWAFQSPGGGEVQLLRTRHELQRLGVRVDLFDLWRTSLAEYDILHLFGSVRDFLELARSGHAQGVSVVVSSIYWADFASMWRSHTGLREKIRAAGHHATKILWPSCPSARGELLRMADRVLPNSEGEASCLRRHFAVRPDRIEVVPNGVDPVLALADPEAFVGAHGVRDFLLCVGRIEPRKNQLALLRVFARLREARLRAQEADLRLVLIGEPVATYGEYLRSCRSAGLPEEGTTRGGVTWLGALPHDSPMLGSAYRAARLFVLPSWLETPGLAAIEAAACGTPVVVTSRGTTREYFADEVEYTDGTEDDLLAALRRGLVRGRSGAFQERILREYSWALAARRTLEVYRGLLGARNATPAGGRRAWRPPVPV
ncbi:MAG: glycosyltransferase family 4 protein [Planctomycetes bacterium]|nr:glycosyltransferase family 4 protein [Planctomycetota bacterium]